VIHVGPLDIKALRSWDIIPIRSVRALLKLSNLPHLTMLGDPIHGINITSFGHGEPSPHWQRVRTLNLLAISVYVVDGHLVTSRGSFFMVSVTSIADGLQYRYRS
jgi:hypothetical protein